MNHDNSSKAKANKSMGSVPGRPEPLDGGPPPWLVLAALSFSAFVFLLDVNLPLGVAGGVPYVALVLAGIWFEKPRYIYFLAVLGSVLTLIGYWVSPTGGVPWVVLANRGLALFAIWVTAFLIASRLRAELAQRKSEERTRLILNAAGEGVYGVDIEGGITFINAAAAEMTGWRADDLVGRLEHETFHGVKPDGRPYPVEESPVRATRMEGSISHVDDEIFCRKDGTYLPVEYTSTPILRGSDILGAVIVFRDITDRKETKRMKSEFISTVSHELRTPLTSIRASLGFITAGVLGDLPEKAARMADIAQKNTERLISIVNDLLDMDKIQLGRMDFRFAELDLHELAERSLASNQPFADECGVVFEFAGCPEGALVNGDSDRLEQALANLLSNAAKFSSHGKAVKVGVFADDERVRVSVSNQGPGIPDEFHDKIFERFSQADSSDARQKGGTGLGLAITKSIIEEHGGRIWFESSAGGETTFFFEIPRLAAVS